METVKAKKYLGDLISCDGKNNLNIKERTNKANGNIEKIVSTLQERPYGRHRFKAYKLMREGLLVGGLLTNAESWINISKQNLEALDKPDTHLLRKVLSTSGNPCNQCLYDFGTWGNSSKVHNNAETNAIPTVHIKAKHRDHDQKSF